MKPLCLISTPFKEKFGTPRQSMLVPDAKGLMNFPKNNFFLEAFRGIEETTHLWLISEFHQNSHSSFDSGLIRPPRFFGKRKLGIFSTRSPHRPNPIGLSLVKFLKFEIQDELIVLEVGGIDLIDGTPILDIKPYVPYVDCLPSAKNALYEYSPPQNPVRWDCEFMGGDEARQIIEKSLSLDPRPPQDIGKDKLYGVNILNFNVRFRRYEDFFLISSIEVVNLNSNR